MEEITVSVLGYREDGEWVAHALEIDILGYGETFEEALQDLEDLVKMQLSFAKYKEDPSLIPHPAPNRYWKIYHILRTHKVRDLISGGKTDDDEKYRVSGFPVHHVNTEKFAVA